MDNVKRIGEITPSDEPVFKRVECAKHGFYEAKTMDFFGSTMRSPCPVCQKEREEKESKLEEEKKNAHLMQLEKKRIALLRKMNIGEKFWDESFGTFDAYTEELKRYLDMCINFANDHQGRMLVMIGNNGNGKDHLAVSTLKKIGGYVYSVFEMELLIRRCYAGKISEWALFRRLCNAPLLVINEIGRHKAGKWEMDFLSHIVNKRYENMRPIIFVSNKHLVEGCQCDECIQHYLGNDIISRIIEVGEIMTFTGNDYRYKKREQLGKNK